MKNNKEKQTKKFEIVCDFIILALFITALVFTAIWTHKISDYIYLNSWGYKYGTDFYSNISSYLNSWGYMNKRFFEFSMYLGIALCMFEAVFIVSRIKKIVCEIKQAKSCKIDNKNILENEKVEKLNQLLDLKEKSLLTEDEFEERRKKLIEEI